MNLQAQAPKKSAVKTPPYAWVVLLAVYLASLAAPLNQFKVPPVMPLLIQAFHLSLGSAGIMMSIFSIMGFVLAVPAGFILRRFGPKPTGLIAVGSVTAGAVLGALSTSTGLFLAGRFVEGVGMGLIMVTAPAAISLWFPAEKRGAPMGLWASCVGVGSIVMYDVAPALAAPLGWRAVWWAGAAFAFLAFLLYAALFRVPSREELAQAARPEAPSGKMPGLLAGMANGSVWLISIEFMCFNLVVMAFTTYYPTFLNTVRGYSLAQASLVSSLIMTLAIFSGPLGGYLSDRLGVRKPLIVVPFVLMAVSMFAFPFTVTGTGITALMILAGIVCGPIAPVSLASVPEVMRLPELVAIGMGVVALGQNLGMFIGPALFGYLVERAGYAAAGHLMLPICLLGIVSVSFARIRQ